MDENVIEKIIEVKEDIAEVKAILSTMANTNTMSIQALESSRSAHKRLDGHDKIIFWGGTTVIGSLVVGSVALLYKNLGG